MLHSPLIVVFLSVPVKMSSTITASLTTFPVPSLNDPKSKWHHPNGSHDIKNSVRCQSQATKVGKESSDQVSRAQPDFPIRYPGKGKEEEIKLWLGIANPMQNDSNAESRIQEPREVLTSTNSLQATKALLFEHIYWTRKFNNMKTWGKIEKHVR